MSKKTLVAFAAALALVVAPSCTKTPSTGDNAEPAREVLRKYVAQSFAMTSASDVKTLKELTVPDSDAFRELDKLEKDPSLFESAIKKAGIKSASPLRIRDEKSIDANHYAITYEIAYNDVTQKEEVPQAPPVSPSGQSHAGESVTKEQGSDLVTTKKYVIFEKAADPARWLISQVTNLKTVVEHGEENISVAPKQAQ